jgi:hypothetical protein
MDASLCTVLYDLESPLIVRNADWESSDFDSLERRVSRVATLDLSASFYDAGFSESDRTLRLAFVPVGTWQVDIVKWFIKYHSELTLAIREGVYRGAIDRVYQRRGIVLINFLVKEKVSL